MLRTMDLALAGTGVRTSQDDDCVRPPAIGDVRWIDVHAPTAADVALLGERFGFHPLALEDCLHQDQRPKAQEYDSYLFLVTQSFSCPEGDVDQLAWHELHAFLGPGYLVTVHTGALPGIERVYQRVARDASLLKRGADFLYYLLVDQLVEDNFPVLEQIADEIDAIEAAVLARPRRESLERILLLRRELIAMRKVLSPQREVMSLLARRGFGQVSEKTSLYLRDVHDQLSRIVESIESSRDLLANALDAYLSTVGQRTNEIMKALALLSAVFMPLTFITGFFGQNFEALPTQSELAFAGMLVSLAASPVLLLLWFKSRHWF